MRMREIQRMKKIIIGLFLVFLVLGSGFGQAFIVKEVKGKVEVQPGSAGWRTATVGMRLNKGTAISTGFNASAVLDVEGAVLQVKPLTRMRIDELVKREGTVSTGLYLKVGKVKADIKTSEDLKHDFTLRSSVSTAAVRGTSFEFDGINLWVENGTVVLSNLLNQARAFTGGQEGKTDSFTPPPSAEDALNLLYEVATSTSGEEGLVILPEIQKISLVVINVQWN
jgi:hypothetical protein